MITRTVGEGPLIRPELSPINYVVSVSGPKLYQEGTKIWMEKKGGNVQLFQKISIEKNSLVYQCYKVSGEIFDSFRIDCGKKGDKIYTDNKQE